MTIAIRNLHTNRNAKIQTLIIASDLTIPIFLSIILEFIDEQANYYLMC
jgi:hypothetical protein